MNETNPKYICKTGLWRCKHYGSTY